MLLIVWSALTLIFALGALVFALKVRLWLAVVPTAAHGVAMILALAAVTGQKAGLLLAAQVLAVAVAVLAFVVYGRGRKLAKEHAHRELSELMGVLGFIGALSAVAIQAASSA